jgi:TolB-like protein/tetratricopeptide (TPR) repeat protein
MSLFNELKRRNVFRVGIAYLVVTWLVMQVADVVINNIGAPDWLFRAIMLVLGLGFPIVLLFAWAFEMTPDGIKKEKDVDRTQSIAGKTGRKLDFTVIGIMAVALTYFVWESRFQDDPATIPASNIPAGTASQSPSASREATAEKDHSIAVLPFANRSNLEDDMFFTDGIHDDLLTQLAKIADLKVISRTSVMKYKNTEKTIPEIAVELGVSTILEGGIQRAGKRIRINAQLIDVTTDEHLWAETFDREMSMENIFDIQSEITRQIVTAVKGELSETEQQSLATAPTKNLDAYEAFLHARAATNRADYTKEKYIEAQPWAERAVKLDPEFAEAWAILMEIHTQAVWLGYDNTPERRTAGREALAKATRLSPDAAFVKTAQAEYFYRFDNNYPAALNALNESLQIAPGDARVLLYKAITQRRLGLWYESITTFEESMRLDPANVFTATQMVDTLTFMNEWDRVESLLNEWITKYPDSRDLKGQQVRAKLSHHGDLVSARALFDLLPPWEGYVYVSAARELLNAERNFDALIAIQDSPEFIQEVQFGNRTDLTKGIAYYLMGNEDRSRQHLQQYLDFSLARTPTGNSVDAFQLTYLSTCWSYLGEHDKALASSREAMEMIALQKDHIFGTMIGQNHTLVLARAGKRDEALERLADSTDGIQGFTRWELYLDPAWDFFRDDERFNELIRPPNLKEPVN